MGFEVIVRPAVLPNIRPAPARVLAPQDNPEQGIAVIGAGGGNFVGISSSYSISFSQQRPHKEAKRQVDQERVYQVDKGGSGKSGKDGNINKNNYIDVERLKRVRLDTSDGPIKVLYAAPPPAPNVETLATDVTRKAE
jgi:hypothetical protein